MIEELEQEMHKKDMENVVMRIELERLHSETVRISLQQRKVMVTDKKLF